MRRLFLLVSAAVLVDTMFFAAVAPLLPQYKEELGLSKSAAGVLAAAYPAGSLAGSIPAGLLATRVGVKPTMLTGLVALGITSLIFGLADSIIVLDGARFAQGVGGACTWAAGFAWLVSAAPPDRRGTMIGSALGAAIIGVLLGPALGGLATVAGPEPVFSGVALVARVLALWAGTLPGAARGEAAGVRFLAAVLRRPAILSSVGLYALPAVFAGVISVLAPLRLSDLGASGAVIGAIFLGVAAVEAVLSPLSGRLSDRRGRLAPIRAGLAGAAIMGLVMPLPGTVPVTAGALLVAVAALGVIWAPGMALLSDTAGRAGLDQALAFGMSNLAWSLGHMVGSGGGAALADATADAVPYAVIGVACALALAGIQRRDRVGR